VSSVSALTRRALSLQANGHRIQKGGGTHLARKKEFWKKKLYERRLPEGGKENVAFFFVERVTCFYSKGRGSLERRRRTRGSGKVTLDPGGERRSPSARGVSVFLEVHKLED